MGGSLESGGDSVKGGAAWDGEDAGLFPAQEMRCREAIGESGNSVNHTSGHVPLAPSKTYHNLCQELLDNTKRKFVGCENLI